MQQLEKSQPQHATISFGGKEGVESHEIQENRSFGNLQQIASGNWQQIGKYCRFRQQLRKMWQQIPEIPQYMPILKAALSNSLVDAIHASCCKMKKFPPRN